MFYGWNSSMQQLQGHPYKLYVHNFWNCELLQSQLVSVFQATVLPKLRQYQRILKSFQYFLYNHPLAYQIAIPNCYCWWPGSASTISKLLFNFHCNNIKQHWLGTVVWPCSLQFTGYAVEHRKQIQRCFGLLRASKKHNTLQLIELCNLELSKQRP